MEKVLFVDDEERLLAGIKRNLRKEFDIHTALSGAEGLEQIQSNGPFTVIVSDMQMPEMNGVEFLLQARAKAPDSVRIMLTGNADQETAVQAINQGDVHQFINKPCETADMIAALNEAAELYRRRKVEQDLLERTFQASVEVMAEIMALANPSAFGRAARLAEVATLVANQLGLGETWSVKTAALLSQMGCISLPEPLTGAIAKGENVTDDDWRMYVTQAAAGADLIQKIPRLEIVAQAIRYQYKDFDGSGYPEDELKGADIPVIARVLRAVLEYDTLQSQGMQLAEISLRLRDQYDVFDPTIVEALEKAVDGHHLREEIEVEVKQLTASMVIARDVVDSNGVLLICRGWEATPSVINHLKKAAMNGQIDSKVLVRIEDED